MTLEEEIETELKKIKNDKKATVKKWNMGLEYLLSHRMTEDNLEELGAGTQYSSTCRYCQKYFVDVHDQTECAGCPIYEYTGLKSCGSTPYYEVDKIIRAYAKKPNKKVL